MILGIALKLNQVCPSSPLACAPETVVLGEYKVENLLVLGHVWAMIQGKQRIERGEKGDPINLWPLDEHGQRHQCIPAAVFDERLAKRFEDLSEIVRELNEVLSALDTMEQMARGAGLQWRVALTSHIVITYARPFVEGKGRGVKAEANASWLPPGEAAKEWHLRLMSIRKKIVAHTDDSEMRARRSFVLVDSQDAPTRAIHVLDTGYTFGAFHDEDVPELIKHVEGIAEKVIDKLNQTKRLILEKAQKAISGLVTLDSSP